MGGWGFSGATLYCATRRPFFRHGRQLVNRVFPAELRLVQPLRRRKGLPEFAIDHLLIDTPWTLVRDLPAVEPHPLAAAVEARLIEDYPQFR